MQAFLLGSRYVWRTMTKHSIFIFCSPWDCLQVTPDWEEGQSYKFGLASASESFKMFLLDYKFEIPWNHVFFICNEGRTNNLYRSLTQIRLPANSVLTESLYYFINLLAVYLLSDCANALLFQIRKCPTLVLQGAIRDRFTSFTSSANFSPSFPHQEGREREQKHISSIGFSNESA